MELEPVMCFQHCQKDTNILCLEMPQLCPRCSQDLHETPLIIPPFRLPSPFVQSKEASYSVVIKPTRGSFLDLDYTNAQNLHVGLTDSRGAVYDYNEVGINRSREGWPQCIQIPVLDAGDLTERVMWDMRLGEITTYSEWIPDRYNSEAHNCYDFAMAFLNLMEMSRKHPSIDNKTTFCENVIHPQIKKVTKYIGLYRQVVAQKVIVQEPESEEGHTTSL